MHYGSDELRTRNEVSLREAIESWSVRLSVSDVVGKLTAAHVPSSPIQTMEQAIESAQVTARGLLSSHDHPIAGEIPAMEQPVHFQGVKRGDIRPAPILGAHTRQILEELKGFDPAVVDRLCSDRKDVA